jgi:hypothetical protein
MSAVNLGTARIAVIVGLVAVGLTVLFTAFDDTGTSTAAPQPSAAPSSTTRPKPPKKTPTAAPTSVATTPSPQTQNVPFAVFNGTDVIGLGAEVQQRLDNKGYVHTQEAANAPVVPVSKTVVYFRGGPQAAQNEADATYLADRYFDGARVSELASDFTDLVPVTRSTEVVVVIGEDFAQAQGP